MKTKEELEELNKEYIELVQKLSELDENELEEITGGSYKKDIGSDKNAKVIFDIK